MIVVTGGAGFIGSAFVWKCNQMGVSDILVVDSMKHSTKWRNLVGLEYINYLHKDEFLANISAGKYNDAVTAIIHMGACSATTETDVDYLMANNLHYTITLAQWCVDHDKRFIYASSAATYGDGEYGFVDNDDELLKLRPINAYGYSKHQFDLYAKRQGWFDKMVGLKFFNVFGPNEYHKGSMQSVVCKAVEQIQSTGKMKLFKSYHPDYQHGEQMRDFVYVKDCVDAMWHFLTNPSINGLFNFGTGKAHTWIELVNAVFKGLNMKSDIEFIEMPDSLKSQYQYYTQSTMDKFFAKSPEFKFDSLEESVVDYVQNYLLEHKTLSAC